MGIAAGLVLVPIAWVVISPIAGVIVGVLCGFIGAIELAPYFVKGNELDEGTGYYLYDEYGNEIGYIED